MEAKIENKSTQQKNEYKISFLKQLIISIKDFDKYNMFLKESFGRNILYMALLVFLFVIILTAVSSKKIIDGSNFNINRLKEYINSITYKNEIISINEDKELIIEDQELYVGKILVNTSNSNDEQITNYKKELEDVTDGIIILKDKIIIKNPVMANTTEISYSEMNEKNKLETYIFKLIIDNWNNDKMNNFINISIVIGFFFVWYYVYIIDTFMNILMLTFLCYITVKILRMNLTFTNSFNISAHAVTLPVILTAAYAIIKMFTAFTIPYFEIMYYGIAYVYILTALFIIKSDDIKMNIDLQKIKEVQEQIKEELELKKEQDKKEKEKEDVNKRDRDRETEKKERNKSSNKKPRINNEPEENNA